MTTFSWLRGRPTTHARHTSRRSTGVAKKRPRDRKLALESLESRTMMSAAPGTLDLAFPASGPTAGSGYVNTAFPIPYAQLGVKKGLVIATPMINATAVLPSPVTYKGVTYSAGSIVAAGTVGYGPVPSWQEDSSFALAIYNPDGSLNKSFGSGGEVETTFFPVPSQGASLDDGTWASAVLLQNVNGSTKIVVTGFAMTTKWTSKYSSTHVSSFAVARYNMDGTLDTTFNSTGSSPGEELFTVSNWIVGLGTAGLQAGMAGDPQNANKVVASAGYLWSGGVNGIVRFNANGGIDTSFGNAGVAYASAISTDTYALPMVVQPDDKIIVGGYVRNTSEGEIGLTRFNADGSIDTSFGTGGLVMLANPNVGQAYALPLQSLSLQTVNGNLMVLAAGTELARFDTGITPAGNPDGIAPGTLDASFGAGGVTTFAGVGYPSPNTLVLARNGDIMLGESGALLAFTPNGALDTNFGSSGMVAATQFPFTGAGSPDNWPGWLGSLAIEADGNILAGGEVKGLFGAASYVAPTIVSTMATANSASASPIVSAQEATRSAAAFSDPLAADTVFANMDGQELRKMFLFFKATAP